jgi:hypothetical protein
MSTVTPVQTLNFQPVTTEKKGLSGWAIFGIVLLVLIIGAAITFFVLYFTGFFNKKAPQYAEIIDRSNLTALTPIQFTNFATYDKDLQNALNTNKPQVYVLVTPQQQASRMKQDVSSCSQTPTPSYCVATLYPFKVIDTSKAITISERESSNGPILFLDKNIKFTLQK